MILLDVLAAALVGLVVIVIDTGGFVVRGADFRLSVQTPTRALVALGIVILARAVFFRSSGLLGMSLSRWRQALLAPTRTDHSQTSAAPGRWRRALIAALGLALGTAALLHEQVLHPYSVPDHGDPLFSVWRMGWVTHALATDSAQLFNANIFHPLQLTLTLSDPIVLPALAGVPLRLLGFHPVVVYNLLVFSAFWLSGVATYLLVERLTGSARAAFVSGLIYSTCAFRLDHYSHLELQMTQWMPFALLALHMLISTGRWPYAFGLALAGVAQLYSGMYYAVFFLVYATVIGIGMVLVQRPSVRVLALPVVCATVLAGGLAVPMVRTFTAAEPIKGERSVDEIRKYSATPIDYGRPNRMSAAWKDRLLPWIPERSLFPGAAPLVFGALGLVPPLGAIQLVYAAGLFTSVDGSFGLNGLVYPYLHRWLSPFRGLRSPARFGAIVSLTLAILSGFGVRRLLDRCRSHSPANVVFSIVIAAVMLDAWPSLGLIPVWPEPPRIYTSLEGRSDVVLAEFPVVPGDAAYNAPYMYFSLSHWAKTVNGYSGFIPQSYLDVAPTLWAFPSDESLAVLRRRGVTHVTMNCGLRYVQIAECEARLARMHAMAGLELVTEAQWEKERVALFALTPLP